MKYTQNGSNIKKMNKIYRIFGGFVLDVEGKAFWLSPCMECGEQYHGDKCPCEKDKDND